MAVEKTLLHNPMIVGWIGDYADENDIAELGNERLKADIAHNPDLIKQMFKVWSLDDDEEEKVKYQPELKEGPFYETDQYIYVVNHNTHEYYSVAKYVANILSKHPIGPNDLGGYAPMFLNPLPLLTCIGNGKGGGDYYPEDKKLLNRVGSWCGHIIEVVTWDDIRDIYKDDYNDISDQLDFFERW